MIEKHSAWDELLTVEYLDVFPHGIDAVCFNTLAQRNKTTRLAIRLTIRLAAPVMMAVLPSSCFSIRGLYWSMFCLLFLITLAVYPSADKKAAVLLKLRLMLCFN